MSTAELVGTIVGVIGALAASVPIGYKIRDYLRKRALPCHPAELKTARGPLHPCSFFIKPDYQSTTLNRWKVYADIEVETLDAHFPSITHVYLIPSGHAPRALHNPEVLKNDHRALLIKRQASILFAKKWEGRELKGFWFYSVKKVPMVYSTPYDKFLNRSAKKYSRP